MNRKIKKALEAVAVIAVAGVLFYFSRKAGVAYRGNELWGGEICVPLLVVGGYYSVKGIAKDIRSGLFND